MAAAVATPLTTAYHDRSFFSSIEEAESVGYVEIGVAVPPALQPADERTNAIESFYINAPKSGGIRSTDSVIRAINSALKECSYSAAERARIHVFVIADSKLAQFGDAPSVEHDCVYHLSLNANYKPPKKYESACFLCTQSAVGHTTTDSTTANASDTSTASPASATPESAKK